MPNLKSAKKRLRQTVVRAERNRAARSAARTAVRRTREAVAAGALEGVGALLSAATARLDKAGKRRVLHPNKVARIKSKLQRAVNAAQHAAPVPAAPAAETPGA